MLERAVADRRFRYAKIDLMFPDVMVEQRRRRRSRPLPLARREELFRASRTRPRRPTMPTTAGREQEWEMRRKRHNLLLVRGPRVPDAVLVRVHDD